MKFNFVASPILFALCLFLAGCGQFGLPDINRPDQVPDTVKAQPRLVDSPPPFSDSAPWPRLGDVPPRPKDFSPKPVYDHYMNELEYDRAVGQDAKEKLDEQSPEPDGAVAPSRQTR